MELLRNTPALIQTSFLYTSEEDDRNDNDMAPDFVARIMPRFSNRSFTKQVDIFGQLAFP
jgi:hypothetical protein